MTLLITIFAAVISTAVWYSSEKARNMHIGMLLYMFWGASLMWLVDAVVEYIEVGAEYFTPDTQSMINDTFLGFSAVALALVVWCIKLLISDKNRVIAGNGGVHENTDKG